MGNNEENATHRKERDETRKMIPESEGQKEET
jgi:hypothetical protein